MSGEMIVYYKVSNSNTRFFVPLVNTTCPYKATDIGGQSSGVTITSQKNKILCKSEAESDPSSKEFKSQTAKSQRTAIQS